MTAMERVEESAGNGWSFISPTHGTVSFDDLFERVVEYVEEAPSFSHTLIVGSDSYAADETVFVTAVVIHRVGYGGRYFYKKQRHRKMKSMRQRIYHETSLSLELAALLCERVAENGFSPLPLEIHLDVGANGASREMIKEVVGMVTGSGFAAVTKPDAYGAMTVADRHSR